MRLIVPRVKHRIILPQARHCKFITTEPQQAGPTQAHLICRAQEPDAVARMTVEHGHAHGRLEQRTLLSREVVCISIEALRDRHGEPSGVCRLTECASAAGSVGIRRVHERH
eukprot:5706840-Prymnesium_polylepis.3